MQAVQGEYNEIIISDEGSVPDYAAYCNKLLQVCKGITVPETFHSHLG